MGERINARKNVLLMATGEVKMIGHHAYHMIDQEVIGGDRSRGEPRAHGPGRASNSLIRYH